MKIWQCKNGPLWTLLALAGSILLYALSRRNPVREPDLNRLRSLLQPVFRAGKKNLSLKEVLEARVLAARAFCEEEEHSAEPPAEGHAFASVFGRAHFRLHWCGHPSTLSNEVNRDLAQLAEDNKDKEILLDRSEYYSMPGPDNMTVMSWTIVQHPLLVLASVYLNLQNDQPRSALSSLLSGRSVTFKDLASLLFSPDTSSAPLPSSAQSEDPRPLLRADVCNFCATHYDFILDALSLETEVAFLSEEMGWRPPWGRENGVGRQSRELLQAVAELVATIPPKMMHELRLYFKSELDLFGFAWDVDAIYESVL